MFNNTGGPCVAAAIWAANSLLHDTDLETHTACALSTAKIHTGVMHRK